MEMKFERLTWRTAQFQLELKYKWGESTRRPVEAYFKAFTFI